MESRLQMKVNFESIDIEGFLSIGEATVDLANQSTVYVKGINESPGNSESNGSGKSTIFEAIIYALTGSTLRGTRDVVNRYYAKGYCSVCLHINVDGVEYEITRTKDHPKLGNNLVIVKDGEDISGGKLRKSEAILEKELGSLTTSFLSNIIILGQGLPNKFTDLGPSARRDRLEELSQSSVFVESIKNRIAHYIESCISTLSEERVNETKFSTTKTVNEDRIATCNREIGELQKEAEVEVASESEIEEVKTKIESFKEKLEEAQKMKDLVSEKVTDYKTRISTKNSEIASNERSIAKLHSDLSKLQTSVCPTCQQYIKSPEAIQSVRETLSKQIDNLEDQNKSLSLDVLSYQESLEVLNGKLSTYTREYEVASNSYMRCRAELSEMEIKGKSNKDQIQRLLNTIEECRNEIESVQGALDKSLETISDLSLKQDIAQYLEKKVSKEFRNYLLSGVIEFLNKRLSYYSQELFGSDYLHLELTENQIYIQYEGRPYENLSGGERQRADLAMQFSLRDMLITTLGFNCNLLVIDEGFDNLDSSGVDALVKVINSMSFVESIFVISHHTLSIPFDSVLVVNKGADKISYVRQE